VGTSDDDAYVGQVRPVVLLDDEGAVQGLVDGVAHGLAFRRFENGEEGVSGEFQNVPAVRHHLLHHGPQVLVQYLGHPRRTRDASLGVFLAQFGEA
jgi:hypothetical protein